MQMLQRSFGPMYVEESFDPNRFRPDHCPISIVSLSFIAHLLGWHTASGCCDCCAAYDAQAASSGFAGPCW